VGVPDAAAAGLAVVLLPCHGGRGAGENAGTHWEDLVEIFGKYVSYLS